MTSPAEPAEMAAMTSVSRGVTEPHSAMRLMPRLAGSPPRRKCTLASWVPPMGGEKWGNDGKSWGWVSALQVAVKTNS